ncbi:hypothetical protein VTO42DRAFT_2594 [Malbranchea cinnamomea]
MTRCCPICNCRIADPCYAHGREAWLAQIRSINAAKGYWALPGDNIHHRRGVIVLHAACWSILKAVFGPDHDFRDQTWFSLFENALAHLNPWLNRGDPGHAPDLRDARRAIDDASMTDGARHGCFDGFRLPVEIVQLVFSYLDDWKDVVALMCASLTPPSTMQLLSLGRMYMIPESPAIPDTDGEYLERIKRLLWGLRFKPESFPHTVNYKAVWDNVELVRAKLSQSSSSRGSDPPRMDGSSNERTELAARMLLSTRRTSEVHLKTVSFSNPTKVSFYFSQVRDRRYLCGLAFDGEFVGYQGDSLITVTVARLCGLLLASDRYGFTALRLKDGSSWREKWYGVLPETPQDVAPYPYRSTFAHVEWPSGGQVKLYASLDIFKIRGLACVPEPDTAQIQAWSWDSNLPARTLAQSGALAPVVQCSIVFPESECPTYQFIDGDTLKSVTSITAHIVTSTGILRKLEFLSAGKVVGAIGSLGLEQWNTSEEGRISFHLSADRGEYINGIAFGRAYPSLAVMFLTNHGRAFQFGQPLKRWKASWCHDGIFGASDFADLPIGPDRVRRSPKITMIGVFRDQSEPELEPPDCSSYQIVRSWPLDRIHIESNSSKWNQEKISVVLSEVNFASASKITVYTATVDGEDFISGMKIFHGEDDYDTTVVGEAIDAAKTFSVQGRGRLRSLSVYYTIADRTKYRINGIRFALADLRYVGVGRLKGLNEELALDKAMPMLFWTYNHDFAYLSTMPIDQNLVYAIGKVPTSRMLRATETFNRLGLNGG